MVSKANIAEEDEHRRLFVELTSSIAVRWAALTALLLATGAPAKADRPAAANKESSLLFVGNSFTHRGGMPKVVAELTKAGNPELRLKHLAFGGSGASIQRHWKGRTALGLITLASLTKEERGKTLKSLRDTVAKDPDDAMAKNGLRIYRILLRHFRADANYRKWDFVALQKYEATDGYMEYAEKFAAEIKARGGRPILYLTATGKGRMNAKPLARPPGTDVVWNDAKVFAEFANRIDAAVAPMPAVALHCNRVRPDLTLRWVNDAHPNQTMAYLTACTFYAAMFNRSPEGLPVDKATDIKTFGKEGKDADGGPLTRTFSPKDRADLQRIAWEAYSEFQKLRRSLKAEKHDYEQAAKKRFSKLANGAWKGAFDHPGTGKWQDKWFLDGAKAKVTNSPTMASCFNRMNLYHISYAAFGQKNDDPKAEYTRARRYMPDGGAYLQMDDCRWNWRDVKATRRTKKLTGDRDWTRLEVDFAPSANDPFLLIKLCVEGTGRAWFDDLELVEVAR